jgi:hypothetical protein
MKYIPIINSIIISQTPILKNQLLKYTFWRNVYKTNVFIQLNTIIYIIDKRNI